MNQKDDKSDILAVIPTSPSKEPGSTGTVNLVSPTNSSCSSEEQPSSDTIGAELPDSSSVTFLDDDWFDEDFADEIEIDEEIQRMIIELHQEVMKCREEVEENEKLFKEYKEKSDRDFEELNNHPVIQWVRLNKEDLGCYTV